MDLDYLIKHKFIKPEHRRVYTTYEPVEKVYGGHWLGNNTFIGEHTFSGHPIGFCRVLDQNGTIFEG